MIVGLFPRLRRPAVDQLLDKLEPTARGSAFALASSLPDAVYYAPTGGAKVPHSKLTGLRTAILEIAKKKGYPRSPDRAQASEFDAEASIQLMELTGANNGEFFRDDVWACIATVLLPDIVIWRFSLGARERFHGGIRNAFQRLWLRSVVLDRGEGHQERWGLLQSLTEDALVQITERPSIASSKELSLALAEGWVRASCRYGVGKMEELMRKVTLQVRLHNEIRHLASMSTEDLEGFINQLFDDAANRSGLAAA
ncbi:hypothetical protein [Methylophaga sp.]|uniref:hypothetical protein n=1 Tax=Methylophaga sp. TaxID=2024840 RepID=UPI003A8D5E31